MPEASEPGKAGERPIVPFLQLGDRPHLLGARCRDCGATYLKGGRVGCSKCGAAGELEEIPLSTRGTLYVYSIVYQSVPGVQTPYVSAIVDLPEKVSVRCNLEIEPDPAKIQFGMPVEMATKKVRTDDQGRDVISFFFRPAA